MRRFINRATVLIVALCAISLPGVAFAAPASNLTQTINPGTLSADIMDASRNPVANPSVDFSAMNFSFDCETTTGMLGTDSERLYVTNGYYATGGWTLTMAATDGAGAAWQNSDDSQSYQYNDSTNGGCDNGQLTVDPSSATVTTDCANCSNATITKGSPTAMTGVTPATLMTGGTNADGWRGYLTGVTLSQKVPAEQPADSYSIDMTLTATAN